MKLKEIVIQHWPLYAAPGLNCPISSAEINRVLKMKQAPIVPSIVWTWYEGMERMLQLYTSNDKHISCVTKGNSCPTLALICRSWP